MHFILFKLKSNVGGQSNYVVFLCTQNGDVREQWRTEEKSQSWRGMDTAIKAQVKLIIGQLKVAANKSHNLEFSLVTERHHKQTFYENSEFCKTKKSVLGNKNVFNIVFQKRLITFNSGH